MPRTRHALALAPRPLAFANAENLAAKGRLLRLKTAGALINPRYRPATSLYGINPGRCKSQPF